MTQIFVFLVSVIIGGVLILAATDGWAVVQNVALQGTASQSTTGFGLPANLAIDGNTVGNSISHTPQVCRRIIRVAFSLNDRA